MIETKSIVSELEKVLREREDSKENKANEDLNRANDFYNKMIQDGVMKKRGYTLRGIDDSHLYFNSIQH